MVCPTCGLDNDPSATACARCNTALPVHATPPDGSSAPAWPPPGYAGAFTPSSPPPGYSPAASPYPPPGADPPPGYVAPQPGYAAPPPPGPPPRNWLPLVAGISVLVLIALVAGLVLYRNNQKDPVAAPTTQATSVLTTDPATTAPTTPPTTATTTAAADPLPQARVVDDVLNRSKSSRDKLNNAIDRVGRCTGLSGALADLRAVGDERRAQIAEVKAADLSAVDNGESIRSTLVTALQHSLDADAAFVEWAEAAVDNGCANTTSRKAAYARGLAASDQAGTSKTAFLAVWNPVAGQLGLPARTRQGI
ncbi:zinc finger Ran-binding domain-containing protein [Paractinoplanes deccanensis]|uniref:hypothetical protein n=1 Tax=Paractinoplanes deccanensis TaxID=113561 RepID=UPI00194338B8|nr:hypothetical protein [Actinoplanes deccanensis]